MEQDKIARIAANGSGPKIALFGIDRADPALAPLGFDLSEATHQDVRQVASGHMAAIDKNLVICTLFSTPDAPHNDAISVIELLVNVGFLGELVVLAPPLLRPKMVEGELRGLAKGISLRFVAGALPPLSEI